MLKRVLVGLGVLLVTGCVGTPEPTERGYEALIVKPWIGKHVDLWLTKWGPPKSTAKLSDGREVWEHVDSAALSNVQPVLSNGMIAGPAGVTPFSTQSYRSTPTLATCTTIWTIGQDRRIEAVTFSGSLCRYPEEPR